jgi:hypothetical protein
LLNKTWNGLESNWSRIRTGFELAANMAEKFPQLAQGYLDDASRLKSKVLFDTKTQEQTYSLCARLAIRALAALLTRSRETEQNLADVTDVIEQIPSRQKRLQLWSDLALRFASAGRSEGCAGIVRRHIHSTLDDIRALDTDFDAALVVAAPARAVSIAASTRT